MLPIRLGRKKLCDFTFTFNNPSILDTLNSNIEKAEKSKTKIVVDGKIVSENEELGLTRDIIPLLNFLVNYARVIRTINIDYARLLTSRFPDDNLLGSYLKTLSNEISLIYSIRTILFYSVRNNKKEQEIFLTQKVDYLLNFDEMDIYRNSFHMSNEVINDLIEKEAIKYMCLQYNELVRDIVPQALERFNVCIKFILDLYLNSINKFQAKENPTKYPNEHVMNILRCAEVGIFELWNMIEPNGYSFEDAMEKMSNSFQKL